MFDDPQVTFGAGGLEREAHLRADAEALAALAAGPGAMVLPLWRGKPLCNGGALGFLAPSHPALAQASLFFIGLREGAACFACDLSSWEPPPDQEPAGQGFSDPTLQHHPLIDGGSAFTELRSVMALLSPFEAEVVASAKALVGWHDTHGFCARCGAKSEMVHGGWQRQCPACSAVHFPRTDPVVIMLVTRGNRVLLGRSPGWPEGMFSLLAGFLEPGETIENAVRREVMEEAGIAVGRVRYLASQPWPFPASLMIGCAAEAQSDTIRHDPVEIEEALWISREDLADVFAGRNDRIKPPRRGFNCRLLDGRVVGRAAGVLRASRMEWERS